MNSPSTQQFPFTASYIREQLRLDDAALTNICRQLNIRPHQDARTGQPFFSKSDVDRIRQTIEAGTANRTALASPAAASPARVSSAAPSSTGAQAATTVNKPGYTSLPTNTAGMSRTDLSLIVDSVSNAKEEILKDLSQLLDDKLSGLDDVVVELIRSKSENDSLKEELKRLEANRLQLQQELSRFKPAAFGFYRKEG